MCRVALLLCLTGCAVGVGEGVDAALEDAGKDAAFLGHDTGYDATNDVAQTLDASAVDVVDADATVPIDSSSTCSGTGVLVTYDFTGQPGNETSVTATSTMAGVTAGSVSRATTLTSVAGVNSINGSNWSTGSVDPTRYYSFTVTAPGCALSITSVSTDTKTSSTGPSSASVATSDDSFTAKAAASLNAVSSTTLTVSGSMKSVEVRVYGFSASGTAGTMRLQNTLTLSGSLK